MNNETKMAIFHFVKYISNLLIFSYILVSPALMVWCLLFYNDFNVYSSLNSIKNIVLEMESTGNRNCTVIPTLWLMIGTVVAGLRVLFTDPCGLRVLFTDPWNINKGEEVKTITKIRAMGVGAFGTLAAHITLLLIWPEKQTNFLIPIAAGITLSVIVAFLTQPKPEPK